MSPIDLILQFPLFALVNYGLAVVAWTCIGRLLLGAMLRPGSPNYILRFFRLLTGWAVRLVRLVTPSYVPDGVLPLAAFVWLFLARAVLGGLLLAYGLGPQLAGGAAAGAGG